MPARSETCGSSEWMELKLNFIGRFAASEHNLFIIWARSDAYNITFLFISPSFLPFWFLLRRPAAEIGDYDPNKHSFGYVSEFRIIPNQTKELESRIVDIHKQIKGIGPAQAEFNFLDKTKWLDMYGVDLHPVLVSSQ